MANKEEPNYITNPSDFVTLAQLREYMDTLRPSLRLIEPDSTAFNHLYMFGHPLKRGCCATSDRQRESRTSTESD